MHRLYAETLGLFARFYERRGAKAPVSQARLALIQMQSLGVAVILVLAAKLDLIPWQEGPMVATVLGGTALLLGVNAWVLRGDRAQEMVENTRGSSCRAAKAMLSALVGACVLLVAHSLFR